MNKRWTYDELIDQLRARGPKDMEKEPCTRCGVVPTITIKPLKDGTVELLCPVCAMVAIGRAKLRASPNETGVCTDMPDLTQREHEVLIDELGGCPYCGTEEPYGQADQV